MAVDNICAACGQPAELKCSACHTAYYCSKQHQKKDWKSHKHRCTAYKVVESDELGRYLVATRNLSPGELILLEPPLISAPSQVTPPLCLGCYKLLNQINSIECTKCGWPVCSTECAESAEHHPECDVTCNVRKAKVNIQTFGVAHPSYQSISVLRCLLQKKLNPQIWDKITQLQSHCEERKATGKYEADRVPIAKFIRTFLKLDEFTEEEILRVAGIVQVNAHEVPLSETGYISIFHQASFMKHDCHANCMKSFTSEGWLALRAAVPIHNGQSLSICYSDPLWGTANRRHFLYESKYFSCFCARCMDATELGTHFSSLKCTASGCDGNLTYASKLTEVNKENPTETFWQCKSCRKTMSTIEVEALLENVGKFLSKMEKNNIEECKKFIKAYEKILHENHYHMVDVKLALVDLIGQGRGGLADVTDVDLDLKLKHARNVYDVATTLVPAENRVRGVLLFELHAALAELSRRKVNSGESDPADTRNYLLESRQVLTDSIKLLSYESEELPEGKMAAQGRQNLQDIDNWLSTLDAMLAPQL